jgi:peptide/nickel transport system substrate-binding protein
MKKYIHIVMVMILAMVLSLPSLGEAQATKRPIELRWVSLMPFTTLDPAQMQGNVMGVGGANLYDTLVFPDMEKMYIPWLAESWKVSSDGKKYTFHLKKGIPFHDGTELTAEDVAFSVDRVLTLKESTVAPQFKKFMKAGTTKTLDKYTIEFNLSERAPQFMGALFLLKIINKKVIMKNIEKGNYGELGDYGVKYLLSNDAGSGPYMVLEHKQGNYLKMKQFERYLLEPWKTNSINVVSIYMIPEAVTEVTKLKAGELDMGEWTLPARSLKEFEKNENFTVSEESPDGIWYCAMNTTKPPLDDPYVRKAVAHAWNTELITSTILVGGKRARGPLPERMRRCADIVYYPYDLEKAKALLKQSKYSADELKKFELELAGGISERYTNIMLLFNSDLKKIGLNPKIVSTTWTDMCQRQQKPETAFHFALITHVAQIPHPAEYLSFYTKDGWGIPYPPGGMYYQNPKVTEAITMGNTSMDLAEQNKYYCQAQKLIAEDSPAIFSHTDFRLFPFWRYVKGYKFPVGAEFFHLRFNRFTMDTGDPLFKKNHGE